MKKSKTKSILAMAVLLGVLNTGAEAGTFYYGIDGGSGKIWDGANDLSINLSGHTAKVWSNDGAVSGKTIYGQYNYPASSAWRGIVIFQSGQVGNMYGGYSANGYASENEVTINGGTISYNLFGGKSENVRAEQNKVTITGGTVGSVYGGHCTDRNAKENHVIMSGGTVGQNVNGGYSEYGLAGNNTVEFSGGLVEKSLYGGHSGSGSVTENKVYVSGGTVNEHIYGGYVYGGTGNVSDNWVFFSGGTANMYIYGGYGEQSGVNITNNIVNISGGTLTKNVYGGYSNGAGDVIGNAVYIDGGTINTNIYGGSSNSFGTVKDNEMIVSGGDLSNAELYGWTKAARHSNNTLQINKHDITIKKVANFENIDITNAGTVTINDFNLAGDSVLFVDGTKITGTAAINGITDVSVESGAKLFIGNVTDNVTYKILSGTYSAEDVSGWQSEADIQGGLLIAYGLVIDNITNNDNEFSIRFKGDPLALKKLDIPNILVSLRIGNKLQKFVENLSLATPDRATQATIINTMANMNSLANVQQGTQAVMAMATGALQTNIGTGSRPMVSGVRGQGSGFRNVSANDKDRAAIETVEQGKSDEVMPVTVGNGTLKYDKTVWANYIHSKKTIDGLKSGHLTQNSTIQYNGVTVGADLWSNAKGFGGLALTTAEGKTNSNQDGASVKNDTDYHGVSLYQRYDYKDVAILFDLSYTHAKNDVTMSAAGTADVTAKPKSDAYSAGVKAEYPVKVGHSSQLTPYAGVRYTHIHTDKYENSLGISNDIKDQNLVNIPVGVQLKTEYTTNSDWKFGHIFEGGYVWNVGNRQSEQRLGYQGVYDSIDFEVTDRGEYFLKTAFTAKYKDTDFELGYRHTRGDNTKENKWNFNVTHNFGNSKGLPYKSVLLGKIDLLESANKELRAENVALKAENERLRALLRAKNNA